MRCADDGVEGRITWANATSMQIRWDDGEQVTWRRDSLAERPIEVLDPPADEPTPQNDEPSAEQATAQPPSAEPAQAPGPEPTPSSPPRRPVRDRIRGWRRLYCSD